MTGDVPYYGGRLTPAQAYGASHQAPHRPAPPPPRRDVDVDGALQCLLDAGVITTEEFSDLRARGRP
jgi:hypothetical protein